MGCLLLEKGNTSFCSETTVRWQNEKDNQRGGIGFLEYPADLAGTCNFSLALVGLHAGLVYSTSALSQGPSKEGFVVPSGRATVTTASFQGSMCPGDWMRVGQALKALKNAGHLLHLAEEFQKAYDSYLGATDDVAGGKVMADFVANYSPCSDDLFFKLKGTCRALSAS